MTVECLFRHDWFWRFAISRRMCRRCQRIDW